MQALLILLIMHMGGHCVNIFDHHTTYKVQKEMPNCFVSKAYYSNVDHRWHYHGFNMCVKNGHWSTKPDPSYKYNDGDEYIGGKLYKHVHREH